MTLPRLGPDALETISVLVARACSDPPSEDELRRALLAPDQPSVIRGDPGTGVVATVTRGGEGFVRLLAVDPDHQGAGRGRALLHAAEDDLRSAGAHTMTVGADAPYYLWPGIDTRDLAAICLLERTKFSRRTETNVNMDVDLAQVPPDPGGWRVGDPARDRSTLEGWAETHWPFWRAEMMRALEQGGLVVTEDTDGLAAVCAHDVNRAGLVGPVAARPDLIGRGVGVAPLLGALHRMRTAGRTRAEIAWVGPIVPYARVGARIGRVFFVFQKQLT